MLKPQFKKIRPVLFSVILILMMSVFACESNSGGNDVSNNPPVINSLIPDANPIARNAIMTVTARASDTDGDVLTYSWTVTTGWTITSGNNTNIITIQAPDADDAEGTVTLAVADGRGGTAAKSVSVSIKPRRIDIYNYSAEYQQIAVNSSGDAVVVWVKQDSSSIAHIWANRYRAGTGWGSAITIETNTTTEAGLPQVAIDNAGNAIAVWMQDSTAYNGYDIYANTLDSSTGNWGSAIPVDTCISTTSLTGPQIAYDNAGNAIAVWVETRSTGGFNIQTRWYKNNSWGSISPIQSSPTTGIAAIPRISFDPNGNAMAVWRMKPNNTDPDDIYAGRYDKITDKWEGVLNIESIARGADKPQIFMDNSGNAIAAWQQRDGAAGSQLSLWFNMYDNSTKTWGGESLLENNDSGNAASPAIAFDSANNAIAVWVEASDLMSRRYNSSTKTWSAAVPVESASGGVAFPKIVISPASGNAIAVWQQWDSANNRSVVNMNRYLNDGSGWGSASLLSVDGYPAQNPVAGIDGNANVIAVWNDTNYFLYAKRFK